MCVNLLLLLSNQINCQNQHVVNGSFESDIIPNHSNQIDTCLGKCDSLFWPPNNENCDEWYNIISKNPAGYYHKESIDSYIVPPLFNNSGVIQHPYDSSALISLKTWREHRVFRDSIDFKKYIKTMVQSKLTSPLISDSLYLVSYRISKRFNDSHSLKKWVRILPRIVLFLYSENIRGFNFFLSDQNDPHYIFDKDQGSNSDPHQLWYTGKPDGNHWMLVRDYIIPHDTLNFITSGNFQEYLTWEDIYPKDTIPFYNIRYDIDTHYFIDSVNVIGPISRGEGCYCGLPDYYITILPSSTHNQNDTSMCCFQIKIKSRAQGCSISKIGYFQGDYDELKVEYETPGSEINPGDSIIIDEVCFSKSETGSNAEITIQFYGKNQFNDDSLMCEVTQTKKCDCSCDEVNEYIDRRFFVTLEKKLQSSHGDDCCWDIFVVNNSDGNFTFKKMYTMQYNTGFPQTTLLSNDSLWSPQLDTLNGYYFNNEYNLPFYPHTKNYIGTVCVPPHESYEDNIYNISFETIDGITCQRTWFDTLKCVDQPLNCCDSMNVSLININDSSDSLQTEIILGCCFYLAVSQFPTPGCGIYGFLVKDMNTQDTITFFKETNDK